MKKDTEMGKGKCQLFEFKSNKKITQIICHAINSYSYFFLIPAKPNLNNLVKYQKGRKFLSGNKL